ncbi:transcription initiation factor TFIID subunit 7-like [Haliotis rufescens]|uniref:transcription initiation factor TFIID subunit 7-like n=1 Tax=Haliotis rufescens TaxID=6454 RepID=UPI001EAFEAB2|nr:transcription initiation factor TFIID subunit 7-like [Haliotis rufescens]
MSGKPPPKKREGNEPFELEQQFILRLPPGPAIALRRDVQSGSMALKDKIGIELQHDMRTCRVRYGGDIFNAKLVDLPCVIESLKTVDKKTFYKTADICQMMICTYDEETPQEEESPKKKDKDKKYAWNHGITPPLKNVKKRRFRKTLRKKHIDQPETEKEVKRLFRYDAEAIDVQWEVITEEDKSNTQDNNSQGQGQVIEASGSFHKDESQMKRGDTSVSLDPASYFGEVSSSEDDEDRDINIMDSGEEETSHGPSTPRVGFTSIDRMTSESMDVGDSDTNELSSKLTELTQQLAEIQLKKTDLEEQLAKTDSLEERDKLQEGLLHLVQEEGQKEREFEILSSMLNQ